jgi:hypothetical protein
MGQDTNADYMVFEGREPTRVGAYELVARLQAAAIRAIASPQLPNMTREDILKYLRPVLIGWVTARRAYLARLDPENELEATTCKISLPRLSRRSITTVMEAMAIVIHGNRELPKAQVMSLFNQDFKNPV